MRYAKKGDGDAFICMLVLREILFGFGKNTFRHRDHVPTSSIRNQEVLSGQRKFEVLCLCLDIGAVNSAVEERWDIGEREPKKPKQVLAIYYKPPQKQ